jgi:amino-acid N-acetyltransferase
MTLSGQVELIRQAFGYITQFRGTLFVIKIDTEIIMDPLFPVLVSDLALLHRLGIRIAIVPGAQSRIDEILTKYGIKWKTVNGIRISTAEAIPFIKMAAFDVSNRVMTLLAENRVDGVIGNWVRARAIGVRDGVDYQESGLVDRIKGDIVRSVLADGVIPIFPNIGWSAGGRPYNISSDELAAGLARELFAEKLFFMGTRAGVSAGDYRLPADIEPPRDDCLPRLTAQQARELLDLNPGRGGDPALNLVRLACQVCESGVPRVHVVDGRIDGAVLKEIFSSEGAGTMIYADEHAGIRPMRLEDIPQALRIMQPAVEKGILVQRSAELLEERLDDFVVFEVDGRVHACGALHLYPGDAAEIAGIAVDESYASLGIGRKVVQFLLQKARKMGLARAFALTTQTWDWFAELGFALGTVADLPPERKETYDRRRSSRVLVFRLSESAAGPDRTGPPEQSDSPEGAGP